jgi:hypothetical protein
MTTTTIGLSPKLIPSIVLIALGTVVALLVDKPVGLAAIVGGFGTLGGGYLAPAGNVAVADEDDGPDAESFPDELTDPIEPSGPESRLQPDIPEEDTP